MFAAFNETSYDSDFKFIKTQHPPKFHYFVSFVVNSQNKLIPRCYPHSLRVFPHRILDFERSALGFGPTGEYKPSEKRKSCPKGTRNKTKAASSRKREEDDSESESENSDLEEQEKSNEENLKRSSQEMKELYKTTARLAADECALPIPPRPAVLPRILGKNGDRELYHSVYQRNGTWKAKVVPQSWDRCQVRPLYENSKLSILGSSRPFLRSQRTKKEVTRLERGKLEKLLNSSEVTTPPEAHVRPTPGYGGFVPKLPVQSSPTRDPRLTQSSSAATYRYYPNSTELKILEFVHKGPLSKLVTTTRPCNPFKKGATLTDHILVHY